MWNKNIKMWDLFCRDQIHFLTVKSTDETTALSIWMRHQINTRDEAAAFQPHPSFNQRRLKASISTVTERNKRPMATNPPKVALKLEKVSEDVCRLLFGRDSPPPSRHATCAVQTGRRMERSTGDERESDRWDPQRPQRPTGGRREARRLAARADGAGELFVFNVQRSAFIWPQITCQAGSVHKASEHSKKLKANRERQL